MQESFDYGAGATTLALTRDGRNAETARTATLDAGATLTRTVSARDVADRWTTATIQQSGRTAKTQTRSFDAAERYATQAGIGFQSAGSYTYDPKRPCVHTRTVPAGEQTLRRLMLTSQNGIGC